jgi:Kef-type K+ transport system membrane component KefB
MVFIPIIKIIISIGLGLLLGLILHLILKRMRKLNEILIVSLGIILFSTAVSTSLGLSIILVNIFLGIILINLSNKNERLFRVRVMYPIMPPIYSLFFALAGITLDISILTDPRVLMIIAIYIVSRILGKYGGIFLGSLILKLEKNIKYYLGMCVIPQAGIAIGLTMVLDNTPEYFNNFPDIITQMINVILISAFINQILGKILTRFSVIKAVDIEIEE